MPNQTIDASTLESAISKMGQDRSSFEGLNIKKAEEQEKLLNKIKLKYRREGIKNEETLNKLAVADLEKIERAHLKKTRQEKAKILEEERKQRLKDLQDEYDMATTNEKRLEALKKLNREKNKQALREWAASAVNASIKAGNDAVKAGLDVYSNYMSGIEARIQGTGSSFNQMLGTIRRNTAVSPYIKQIDVIQNLNRLVSQGIAYNVEQRAFLETISDKIATTFDATNGTLLRLIRIQQADTTASRLGLEAQLTRYLNATYKDTSYLSDQFDNVSQSLYEATALAGRNVGVELEYVVQKWLGSLYGVGASDTLISNLAQGIGYLGSGNTEALSSNEALQNLFVMASSRTGLDYSRMLTEGLSPQAANQLLRGVVEYIREIGRTENIAIRSQYANIFGMTISDMTALLNLSTEDLVSISKNMLTYSDTISEVQYQLNQVSSRTHISELINNVLANASLSLGLNVASNAVTYGIYKAGEVLDKLTGGIEIPFITALGTGTDLKMTFGQAMQTGILGLGAIGTLIDAISSISSGGGLNLNAWGAQEYTSRGSGVVSTSYGSYQGISSSAIIGNASTETLSQSITGAQGEAVSVAGEPPKDTTVTDIKDGVLGLVSKVESIIAILDRVTDGDAFRITSLYNGGSSV